MKEFIEELKHNQNINFEKGLENRIDIDYVIERLEDIQKGKKKTYYERKEEIRQEAIDWQLDFNKHNYRWLELANWGDYFYKKGKRYGLLKEFKENGIC